MSVARMVYHHLASIVSCAPSIRCVLTSELALRSFEALEDRADTDGAAHTSRLPRGGAVSSRVRWFQNDTIAP
eukprot:m.2392 g.2392  ORF g.2392 m.2392 type:complete len:73 (+) comp1450_c0_seq1:74-292(+)